MIGPSSGVRGWRRLGACLAAFVLLLVLGGCGLSGGSDGDGSASFTVTYEAEDGVPVTTELVEVAGVRCSESGAQLLFGDVSDSAELSVLVSVSPSTGHPVAFFTLMFGDGLVFHSTEVFDAEASGFTLDGQPGFVAVASDDPWVAVDPTATVAGSVTC